MIGHENFPRELQWTDHTCGPCSVFAVASFFGVDVTYAEVKESLKTDEDGTAEVPVVRFLRSCGLRVAPRNRMGMRQLEAALDRGSVVLVGLDEGHYGVVHAIDDENGGDIHLMDPSLRRQLGRAISAEEFKSRWTREGIAVGRRPRSKPHLRA